MKKTSGEKPPPKSTDLEGWRCAIAEGRLRHFRLEAIAAAFQDLGPHIDRAVRDALTKHLSSSIIGILRKKVWRNRANNGEDIILDVHDQIFEALLQPQSADGKGLREAFGARVIFRMKTAIADELRAQIIPAPKRKKAKCAARVPDESDDAECLDADQLTTLQGPEAADAPDDDGGAEDVFIPNDAENEELAPGKNQFDSALLDGVRETDQQIDVDRILATIPSYKKQLAFRLYMDDVPWKSTKGNSIAKACGVSEKTARTWVKEIEADLKQNKEAQELLKSRAGAKS